ncbi:MAG: GatB/YqeY domain-containing protein [Bacteroidales bacterium]|jgi:uncharacterized protein YqeY|nr:GatB/YqeY domain-containing protein [Bacteroidales bacterium]
MDYFEQINADLKTAMLAREAAKTETLRGIKKEFLEAKTAKDNPSGELPEDKAIKILQKMVKQRKEAAEIYKTQGRQDLYDNEMLEAGYIEHYLPAQLSREEIANAVRAAIAATGASSAQDMGKVMGVVSKQLAGKAEGKIISEVVRELLS